MKDDKGRNEILKALSLFTQLGLNMAVCVLIGVLAGKFLDGLFGTSPLLLLIFAFLGSAAAIKVLFDIVRDRDD